MWNNTDIPVDYLITFRCYGTWLHGDKRGSIDRFHNVYKSPYIKPNPRWHRHNAQALEGEPVILDERRRTSVERAICETCRLRKWHLHVLSVRTNHIHLLCRLSYRPTIVLRHFFDTIAALEAFQHSDRTRQNPQWKHRPGRANRSPWARKSESGKRGLAYGFCDSSRHRRAQRR